MATQTVVTSKRFSITLNDFWRGLLVAVGTPIITILMNSLNAGSLVFNWIAIGTTALAALGAYLLKNFFTPAKIIITDATPETVEAVKEGTAEVKVVNT